MPESYNVLPAAPGQGNCAAPNIGMDYIGTDIEGTVFGGDRNYCTLPESAYQSVAFRNIWQFEIVFDRGDTQPVYCLEKGRRGPQGNRYRSAPIHMCLPELTDEQVERIHWILANSYPAIGARQLFACAGVDASLSPPLDNRDAYAATQIALWSAIDPPADLNSGWNFVNCADGGIHPKSARLSRVVAYLYNGSVARSAYEDASIFPIPMGGCRTARAGDATLIDCGPGALSTFCGKTLYGPLMVRSDAPFTLEFRPLCAPLDSPGFITLTDGCGTPLRAPVSDQEFYIAFPPGTKASCYELTLTVTQTAVTVATLCNIDGPADLQAIAAVPGTYTRLLRASLCLCFAPPCETCCEKREERVCLMCCPCVEPCTPRLRPQPCPCKPCPLPKPCPPPKPCPLPIPCPPSKPCPPPNCCQRPPKRIHMHKRTKVDCRC